MADIKYRVELGGRSVEVVLESNNDELVASVNGKKLPAELFRNLGDGLCTVAIANRRATLVLSGERKGFRTQWAGRELPITVEPASIHELRRHLRASTAVKSGEEVIQAHMPGLIVKILVEPGQTVSKGDGLLVIEAMKMENEIRATRDGVVQKVMVKEGHEVKGGQPLCAIRPDTSEQAVP